MKYPKHIDIRNEPNETASAKEWIQQFIRLNGVSPTIRECGEGWGVSHGTAHTIVRKLAAANEIEYISSGNRRIGRGITIAVPD